MVCYTIVHYNVMSLFVLYGHPPTAMDAVLATIVYGGQAIIAINIEAVKINYFLFNL
jgi:hypothetical protein